MLTLWPTSRLTSVDLPTLGRPSTATKPERNEGALMAPGRGNRKGARSRSAERTTRTDQARRGARPAAAESVPAPARAPPGRARRTRPAPAGRRRRAGGRAGRGRHGEGGEAALAGRDRGGQGGALGAQADRVRGVLDVHAGERGAGGGHEGRSHAEARVRRVGLRGGGSGLQPEPPLGAAGRSPEDRLVHARLDP